ncbi:MAG TPA: carboxyl transferase domain-containing protein, partial [Tenuifilaceae bacterium]|nr:carboxyl transferase domain-containing protein [Tenuifilaceae bacterium]
MKTLDELYQELERRNKIAEEAGGADRVAKQHESGKKTARERIVELLDPGTFNEFDKFVTHRNTDFGMADNKVAGDGVVTGYGKIDGRLVYVYAYDFTVFGGTLSRANADKIIKLQQLAIKMGAPILGLNDSGGARIQEGVQSLAGYAEIFHNNVKSSGVIPQITCIMGPCAGGAVYSPALTDFIVMVKDSSYMFVTGPDVIKAVTHEEVTKDELGGAVTHNAKSGVAHFIAENDEQALMLIRELMSFLPVNNMEEPPVVPTTDDINREDESLQTLIPADPNRPYDIKDLITTVVDDKNFLEVQPMYAKNIVIGFARMAGHSVGIVANQPAHLAG